MRSRKARTFLITQSALEKEFDSIPERKIPTNPIYMTAKEADQLMHSSDFRKKSSGTHILQRRSDVINRQISFLEPKCESKKVSHRKCEGIETKKSRFFGVGCEKSCYRCEVGSKIRSWLVLEFCELSLKRVQIV